MARKAYTIVTFSGSSALHDSIDDFARDRRMNKSELIRKIIQWVINNPKYVDENILKGEETEVTI